MGEKYVSGEEDNIETLEGNSRIYEFYYNDLLILKRDIKILQLGQAHKLYRPCGLCSCP